VVVTITGTNDAPVATDDAQGTTENAVLNSSVPVPTDVDGTIDPNGYLIGGTNVAEGSLTFNADGTYSFDPGTDFDDLDLAATRDVNFTYTALDNNGLPSAEQTITITVTGTNDAPTISDTADIGFIEAINATAQNLDASGTVSFDDIDTNDVVDISTAVTTSAVWSGGAIDPGLATQLGNGFSASVTNATAPGNTPWTYSVANADLEFLATGETITLEFTITATDSNAATATDTVLITITGVDESPLVLTTTGTDTARYGETYTLNLNSNQVVDGWIINWGDGDIETIIGDPASVDHTYTNLGFTNNITASAYDSGGTYMANDLLVGSSANDTVKRYDAITGAFLQTIGATSTMDYNIDVLVGPDGYIYASSVDSGEILRFDASTGNLVEPAFVSGFTSPSGMAFGPNGNLYVSNIDFGNVIEVDASTGTKLGAFVLGGTGGLTGPVDLAFGADGHLYVADYDGNAIRKYDGTTGAYLGDFVASITTPEQITFGPDGHLYVSSDAGNRVERFDGSTGASMGNFVDPGVGGLSGATGLAFGPDGNLYVSSWDTNVVLRYQGPDGASPGTFIGTYASGGSLDEPSYLAFLPSEQVKVIDPTPSIDLDLNDSSGSTGIDFNTSFTEDAGSVLIADADATLGNAANLTALNVTITNQLDGVLETLAANTSGTSIVASYNSGTGVLSLTGLDSVANYQQVLRTVTYNNSSQFPNTTNRTITFVAWLNTSDSNVATTTVAVNGTNDAATVSSDSQVLIETDATLATGGILTSTDADNPDDTFTPVNIVGTIGTFDINAAGVWTFTANSAFDSLNVGDNVSEVFNLTSIDGTASTVTIQINGTNDAATVSSDSQVLVETDAPLATGGTLTSSDVDNPDDTFTAANIVGVIGTFDINAAGVWTFTANSAFDNLNVGDNVNETFNVTSVDGTASTVQIQINGTNDAATVRSRPMRHSPPAAP
jgi:VCBS repeat-containing protein